MIRKPFKCEVVEVTPVMASRWLEKHVHQDWQRKLVQGHVDHLARLMKDGVFLTGYIVFGKVDGQAYCANGMHTLSAIVEADQPQRCLVEWYHLADMKDYVRLFHCFDTENRRRTSGESAQAFLMGSNGELPAISPFHLDTFRKGVDFYHAQVRPETTRVKATQFEKFDAVVSLRDELDVYVWLAGQEAARELLHRTPVIAAIVATYRANQAKCKKFWKQVVTGFFENQDPDDPCVKLNRFLQENAMRGQVNNMVMGNVTRQEMYAACIRAWNAYIDERPLTKLQARLRSGASMPTAKSS